MIVNEGEWERIVRVVVGVALVCGGYLAPYTDRPWSFVVMAVGFVLVATGLIGYCPAWHLLRISTSRKNSRE
ncbi:MAG: YgaP family membrane protein [Acidiferrobacteraceae bacterium]